MQEIRDLWAKRRELSINCQYWSLAVDSFGDHQLGDFNGDRTSPSTKLSPGTSNPPPIPKRPARSSQSKQPPSELDIRVPIQKVRGTSNTTLARSIVAAEPSQWNCLKCNYANHPELPYCEHCQTPKQPRA